MTGIGQEKAFPRLVIAAPHGRSGKTTVTLGLAAVFAARGLAVQPFKKGPDYIDPSWLSAAARRPCRTLDPFFMPTADTILSAFVKGKLSSQTPLASVDPTAGVGGGEVYLIEGNHGLYDSSTWDDLEEGAGSTAALARVLRAPILLVVSGARMGRSAAALILGYQKFEPDTPIAGVILNNVARERHADKLQQAIERYCGIPVLGILPSDARLAIPDRHLGLLPQGEDPQHAPVIDACRDAVERHFDLDSILALARSAPAMPQPHNVAPATRRSKQRRRIAVFQDRAFSFYYHENLEALVEAGTELVYVDSLRDEELPDADLLYIGGGFPEVFMEALSANVALRHHVRAAASRDMPIYAECGGLMYLAQSIRWGRRRAEMAGVLPIQIEVTDKAQGHGYVVANVTGTNPIFVKGATLRGHEFHNSRVSAGAENVDLAYKLSRGRGIADAGDGIVYRGVLASYTHLHVAGAPGWAEGMVGRT